MIDIIDMIDKIDMIDMMDMIDYDRYDRYDRYNRYDRYDQKRAAVYDNEWGNFWQKFKCERRGPLTQRIQSSKPQRSCL